jgi:hypothetical protein
VRQDPDSLDIYTLEGVMHAATGDWIIRGVKGELYACKDEIFRMTYEPADAAPAEPQQQARLTDERIEQLTVQADQAYMAAPRPRPASLTWNQIFARAIEREAASLHAGDAAGQAVEKDAARFVAIYGERFTEEVSDTFCAELEKYGNRPTLDQYRAAIDAALSTQGEKQ